MKPKLTIARAGGGTWGHTFPIKSLLTYLQQSPHYCERVAHHYRLGNVGSLEAQTAQALQKEIKNLTFLPLSSGKRRREKTFAARCKNLQDLCKFTRGVLQSLYYLSKYKVDIVFCKGGYVALPVVCAAKLLSKKIYVHESDTRPGLVNRIAAKFATQSFSGFDQVLPWAKIVGQLLSDELLSSPTQEKKSSEKTQVLVMGGSQWAKSMYEALAKILSTTPELQKIDFTLILGQLNSDASQLFTPFSNVQIKAFCTQQELGLLYQASDVAITRAGTTSLAEQELFDLKLVMIPIPRTHDQLQNAQRYVKQKGGILIQQDDPDFIAQLTSTLCSLIDYKKVTKKRDLLAEITTAKEFILDAMLT